MKEVKTPKKPLIFYYFIALVAIILFNSLVMPMFMKMSIVEVDYGTFMQMAEDKQIGEVEISNIQITFTGKDDNRRIYKTGVMDDPQLADRLYEAGAKFSKDIEEPMSPLLSIFLTWILPIIIFIGLGQYMNKKLMQHAGGKDSMMFGMGKSTMYCVY